MKIIIIHKSKFNPGKSLSLSLSRTACMYVYIYIKLIDKRGWLIQSQSYDIVARVVSLMGRGIGVVSVSWKSERVMNANGI